MLAFSNIMTLNRVISKGFRSNNAVLAPLDIGMCKAMILQPAATKRPDQIPLDQGVSYIPMYTKQRSSRNNQKVRRAVLTGTGEAADECEIGEVNVPVVPSPPPTLWTAAPSAKPTLTYVPSTVTNSTTRVNGSVTVNGQTDFDNTTTSSVQALNMTS